MSFATAVPRALSAYGAMPLLVSVTRTISAAGIFTGGEAAYAVVPNPNFGVFGILDFSDVDQGALGVVVGVF